MLEIGRYLTEIRKYYNLKQEELAGMLSVSRQAVSRWETGASVPDIETLMKLSKLYGVTINEILEADVSTIRHAREPEEIRRNTEKRKMSVIGCGRWGTFIAWYLDRIGHEILLYGRKKSERLARLKENRSNEYMVLPESVSLTDDLCETVKSDIILISIEAQQLQNLMNELSRYQLKNKIIVLCMKGLEIETGRRLSQIADDNLDISNKTAVWLGPGHVEEYYRGIPNCMVIDSSDELLKEQLVSLFSGGLIRFYYGMDLVGNEIGAAAKNVIGIAAGMLDGLHRSTLKGPLMSRGTREIARLINAMGGNGLSAYGLCHLGDYEATVFSEYSHNRQYGESFVQGKTYDRLAEGYYTVKALVNLGKNHGVELPICRAVYNVLYCGKQPVAELDKLFKRRLKEEF